jgi:hypothetical protein
MLLDASKIKKPISDKIVYLKNCAKYGMDLKSDPEPAHDPE